MLRVVGAALVMGGGLWLGLGKSRSLSRRARLLEEWAQALLLIEGEMSRRLPPLPQLFHDLAPRCGDGVGEVLAAAERGMERLDRERFSQIWTCALEAGRGGLTGEDLEGLRRLGSVLGAWEWDRQRAGVEETRQALLERSAALRQSLSREGRSYAAAGLAAGAFLTIVLL